jgi:hypothetical protein
MELFILVADYHCDKAKKVNLSLCLIKQYAMKTYGGVDV